ncbi:glycosyltransferase [Cohnella sp. REN36]|uniref:glycosyltransferase n=1 Tax=Cohnella sp. REN36 TaxID=2887347 RepID=UPI001D14BC0B|nr:glycosyltransferase [Cohnella sp. REN36]MCC3374065.1 glycosyltransferase [Cohnella sp. REN36]
MRSLNPNKVCFITCYNDQDLYEESLRYIQTLHVPAGIEVETISIAGATSLAAGYNHAMQQSDAKYKVYLHQDVFIINRNMIQDVMSLFQENPNLGMIGLVGAEKLPMNAIWWQASSIWGKVYENHTGRMNLLAFQDVNHSYQSVESLDGLLLVTQFDLPWQEEHFDGWHMYDLSQSMEFKNHGYDVGVPNQQKAWAIHDCGIVNVNNGFEKYRHKFLQIYGPILFPKVSVLIPTFNRPELFEAALQSALSQSYPNIEIIVGDDSTNDETERLIQIYLATHQHIRYYRNENNLGQFQNDLKLLELSHGEYINFLMDDDLFHPEKISKMMKAMLEFPNAVIATSKRQIIDSQGRNMGDIRSSSSLFDNDVIVNGFEAGEYVLESIANTIGEPTTVLFKKSALTESFGTFYKRDYICNVDLASWFTLLAEGDLIYFSDPLSYFRVHDGQQQNGSEQLLNGVADFSHLVLNAPNKGFYKKDVVYYRTLRNCREYNRKIFAKLKDVEKSGEAFKIALSFQEKILTRMKEISDRLPLVSILIPAYNRPDFIRLALESALEQTYPKIEIIISDDSTNDEVEEVIQSFVQKYDYIRYIRNPKPLANLNLQQCLDNASGEYIQFLMDDDLFMPKKTEVMLEYLLTDNNITLVTSYREIIDENGNIIPENEINQKLFANTTTVEGHVIGEYCLHHLSNKIGEPSNVMFRRQDIVKYGMFNGNSFRFINDFATWMHLLSKGKMVYIAEPLSFYRIHSNQNQQKIHLRMWNIYQWYSMLQAARSVGYLKVNTHYKQALYRHLKMSIDIMGEVLSLNRLELLEDKQARMALQNVINEITAELVENKDD